MGEDGAPIAHVRAGPVTREADPHHGPLDGQEVEVPGGPNRDVVVGMRDAAVIGLVALTEDGHLEHRRGSVIASLRRVLPHGMCARV